MRKTVLLSIGISMLLLTGCGVKNVSITADKAKTNEIIVSSNKNAQTVIKESFNKKYYKEKELKSFINDDIKSFNKDNGTSVKLNSMKVKEGNVYVVIDYTSIDEMNNYNTDTKLSQLSASKAKKSDLVPSKLNKFGKKTKVKKSAALKKAGYKVVILEKREIITESTLEPTVTETPAESDNPTSSGEPTATPEPSVIPTEVPKTTKVNLQLTVAGKIKYASNATKVDKNTAKIKTLDEPVVIVYK
jgi:hypothetical protein